MEDHSGHGHFGMPYKAYKKKRQYDVYRFTRSRKKSYELNKNINPNAPLDEKTYVRKRPERMNERYIKRHYPDYCVKDTHDKKILRLVRKNRIYIYNRR